MRANRITVLGGRWRQGNLVDITFSTMAASVGPRAVSAAVKRSYADACRLADVEAKRISRAPGSGISGCREAGGADDGSTRWEADGDARRVDLGFPDHMVVSSSLRGRLTYVKSMMPSWRAFT